MDRVATEVLITKLSFQLQARKSMLATIKTPNQLFFLAISSLNLKILISNRIYITSLEDYRTYRSRTY